jgi:hypothetical protein
MLSPAIAVISANAIKMAFSLLQIECIFSV